MAEIIGYIPPKKPTAEPPKAEKKDVDEVVKAAPTSNKKVYKD